MNPDEQQIRELIERWHRATAEGDLDTILSMMTDDAVFLTPGRTPMNKEGFAAAFRGFGGKVKLESKFDIKEMKISGDLAYCWTHISVVMRGRERTERSGYTLTVFRKTAGTWQLARDANLMM